MKKSVLSAILLSSIFSLSANANSLTGIWCQKYDDFFAVLKIESTGDLITYSQGIKSGEIVREGKGFISQGASSMQMVINDVDQQVIDAEVTSSLLGTKKLILSKADGSDIEYNECQAK